jgi:hypothetical protein
LRFLKHFDEKSTSGYLQESSTTLFRDDKTVLLVLRISLLDFVLAGLGPLAGNGVSVLFVFLRKR